MTETILEHLLAHNNWANLRILDACAALSDEQLDFQPAAAVRGTIRETLHHLVTSQEDYLWLLTRFDHPPEREPVLTLPDLRAIAAQSGAELAALAPGAADAAFNSPLTLSDGYRVAPWVILTQVINHATEHREQVKSILSALGIEPPRIDGWLFGRDSQALIPPAPSGAPAN